MADQKFVQFLRELADWYEEHPTVPAPYALEGETVSVYLFGHPNPKEVLRAIGSFDKKFTSGGEHFTASKLVAGKTLEFTFYRDSVCIPKVVGTRYVEEQLIPEQYVPSRVIPAHEEDIVEYDCQPVLRPEPKEEEESDQEVRVPSHVETDAKGIPF
jgi:hypothetical protein